MNITTRAAALAVTAALALPWPAVATAAALAPGTIPATRVATSIPLRDPKVGMQSMARTSATGSWMIAQVSQSGRGNRTTAQHAAAGDMTVSHVSAAGTQVLSYMYLRGFGHGESIGITAASPGLYLWAESNATLTNTPFPGDAFGTRIARIKWAAGTTVTPSSPTVKVYNPLPGNYYLTPSIDADDNLIGVRYMDPAGGVHVAVYDLDAFTAGAFTPLRTIDLPAPPGTDQGWALLPGGDTVAVLTGDHYTDTNPSPGNTKITWYDSSGAVTAQSADLVNPGMVFREPEGLTVAGGVLYSGFTSGNSPDHRANIYSQ
jgi:hypothetical protein